MEKKLKVRSHKKGRQCHSPTSIMMHLTLILTPPPIMTPSNDETAKEKQNRLYLPWEKPDLPINAMVQHDVIQCYLDLNAEVIRHNKDLRTDYAKRLPEVD
jgi:hypothetical protein